jgi:hypothetical protein
MMRVLFAFVVSLSAAQAFVARSTFSRVSSSPPLQMVKFDKKDSKWIATAPEEMPDAGYGPIKTLLLHGPEPFISRMVSSDDYEQSVLKFMAGDKVSRIEAQGNMDAYLRNPADWAFNRMEEQSKGKKYDYWTLKPKKAIVVSVWSAGVFFFAGVTIYSFSTGENFNDVFFGIFS